MLDLVIEKLQEPSTWRGIIGLATAAGVKVAPELATEIIACGIAVMGIINVIRKERKA